MLVKVLGLMFLIAIILVLIYFIGMAIYDHFVTRPAVQELKYHSNKLETLLKDIK